MQFSATSLIFFGLLAIIPALIVAVIAILRIESLRVAIVTIEHGLENVKSDFAREQKLNIDLHAEFEKLMRKQAEADADNHSTRLKTISLEESINSVNNKLNSRERVERKQQRKEEEREAEEAAAAAAQEIPGTEQQTLPLFQPINNNTAIVPPRRRFGQMPSL